MFESQWYGGWRASAAPGRPALRGKAASARGAPNCPRGRLRRILGWFWLTSVSGREGQACWPARGRAGTGQERALQGTPVPWCENRAPAARETGRHGAWRAQARPAPPRGSRGQPARRLEGSLWRTAARRPGGRPDAMCALRPREGRCGAGSATGRRAEGRSVPYCPPCAPPPMASRMPCET